MLGRIIDIFLRGRLAPMVMVASLAVGLVAMLSTPREEEPQIVVPMADVFIDAPGLPPAEVERQVVTPLEKLLHQIDGVEHVYSVSRPGGAVVTVRFYVGRDPEQSLVDIYDKLYSNADAVPPDVRAWVVKPIEIDDVPIVDVTLWSDRPDRVDDYQLRRIAEELEIQLQAVPQTNRTQVIGGRPRVVRVELNPQALAARQTSALDVAWALQVSNAERRAGRIDQRDTAFNVDVGRFFGNVSALKRAVVNVVDGTPVLLEDVARVVDGPAEASSYTWIGFGPADHGPADHGTADVKPGALLPAVHVAVAKQRGTNAVEVARRIEQRVAQLAPTLFPEGVHARITRDYGKTANDKVNELLEALAVALIIVIALIAYTLGWREGLIVAAAVPITFALTLMINYWAGYTINRVTLFALILSLGLVVDDPVVDVENIHRHLRMGHEPPLRAIRTAVNEVRPPILLATLAVIVSFLPMYLITGMMGPYMRPMALNVPIAMLMSMAVAFMVTPWLSYKILRSHSDTAGEAAPVPEKSRGYRLYESLLDPFLRSGRWFWGFILGTVLLFAIAVALPAFRAVPLKLLPFDNKSELQIMVDPPEGTTLERTDAILRSLTDVLRAAPEVKDFETYAGLASPMDFNGMVRHTYLRNQPNQGEIRINLIDKRERQMQSHEIALRLRGPLEAVAAKMETKISIVEVPPGPPVLATITAEVSGPLDTPYARIRQGALDVANRLAREPGVGDVDTTVEADSRRLVFVTDKEKAALSGVATEDIAQTVQLALSGLDATRLHLPGEVNPLAVRLRLPRADRSGAQALAGIAVKGRPGIAKIRDKGGVKDAPIPIVRIGELGAFERLPAQKAIYHKDLQRVAYVYAEPVGRAPADVVADVASDLGAAGPAHPRPLAGRTYFDSGGGIPWMLPKGVTVSWFGEGELNITKDVFRDLGIAFGVALIGIYLILVYQTGSYAMPFILMISIPLTMIGIMPGFWLLNMVSGAPVAGHPNPTFFTATAMIGMIALAGIAVRNAILLIEFLHVRLRRGLALREAVIEAGAVRTRPILLTAGPAMLAAVPITLDPVFAGLAWALIFGLFVSTAFTLLVVPMTYFRVYRNKPGHGLPVRKEHDA